MSSIAAGTTTTTALVSTADTTGSLVLKTGASATTALTLDSSQNATFAKQVNLAAGTASLAPLYFVVGTNLTTATAGAIEYDGKVIYATPQGTQRGVVPGAQFFRLDSALAGANVNTAQNVLGVGVTLSASTVYAFEAIYALSKTAGTTSHSVGLGFGGTATLNNISYAGISASNISAFTSDGNSAISIYVQTASNTTFSNGASSSATLFRTYTMRGTVSVNAGGTFIPQYTLSAAPGGAYTTALGSYFMIYPIGESGANISVGTWA